MLCSQLSFWCRPPRGGFAMAPRDSGMCWKQFMMCLEEDWFVAMIHLRFSNLIPRHDPELGEGPVNSQGTIVYDL